MFDEILLLIIRLILGLFFVKNGLNHLWFGTRDLEDYARYAGVPSPRWAVFTTGTILVAGGLSVATGLYVTIGILALVAFLLVAAFKMHTYWQLGSADAAAQNPHFWKNLAIAAGLLALLLVPQPWPWTI